MVLVYAGTTALLAMVAVMGLSGKGRSVGYRSQVLGFSRPKSRRLLLFFVLRVIFLLSKRCAKRVVCAVNRHGASSLSMVFLTLLYRRLLWAYG